MTDSQLATFKRPSELFKFLEPQKGALQGVLPKHLNAERMFRLATTCFAKDPKLRECTGISILGSLMVAALLGLEPGVDGQGYLIAYKGTCTFVPGWKGMVGLLNNSGRATAWTGAVFEGDEWDFQLGSEPRCFHRPGENFGDLDKLKWVYACGKIVGIETPIIEAWPIHRVWLHRDRFNKLGNRHYSFSHPEMYARKVVLLQILKYLPHTTELANAIAAANSNEMGMVPKVQDGMLIEAPIEKTWDDGAPDPVAQITDGETK